ncbi:glycosyl hydrolase [Paraburkholderia sp. UYCP14C]|uniref:sialidase family protein n=1 Tax=Paraburkholderia sp. UYCP14C TaxID=2511130 RepID=UPI00102048F7|nr:sialidase family protein [Paraburkholderia sp. UYCP14C]RZF29650.1 glycosyl hydrolase [Paraburkholderia sp. UYCP14C]
MNSNFSGVAAAVSDNRVRTAYADAERKEAFLPTYCVQNHAANLHVLDNGDLLCVWFGGTQEGIPDVSIYMSRLAAGTGEWSAPRKLSDDPTRSEQNPVLFNAPDGRLWLIYTAQLSGHQNTAIVRRRVSMDGGVTWGPVETLFDRPGTFVRQPIIALANGTWICPVFLCRTQAGERWVGNDDVSAVMVSADQGGSWELHEVPESVGCVHMNVHVLQDGSLLALYRSRWADFVYASRSVNGKEWSAPQPTDLPNNNSSIQFTVLKNGHLALVFNESDASHSKERRASLYDDIEDSEDSGELRDQQASARGTALWGAPRAPMSLAISEDGGKTWRRRRNLEIGDGYCMTNNSADQRNREYSYPSIVQSGDGALHIAFTWFRQKIKYVCVDESWVRG